MISSDLFRFTARTVTHYKESSMKKHRWFVFVLALVGLAMMTPARWSTRRPLYRFAAPQRRRFEVMQMAEMQSPNRRVDRTIRRWLINEGVVGVAVHR